MDLRDHAFGDARAEPAQRSTRLRGADFLPLLRLQSVLAAIGHRLPERPVFFVVPDEVVDVLGHVLDLPKGHIHENLVGLLVHDTHVFELIAVRNHQAFRDEIDRSLAALFDTYHAPGLGVFQMETFLLFQPLAILLVMPVLVVLQALLLEQLPLNFSLISAFLHLVDFTHFRLDSIDFLVLGRFSIEPRSCQVFVLLLPHELIGQRVVAERIAFVLVAEIFRKYFFPYAFQRLRQHLRIARRRRGPWRLITSDRRTPCLGKGTPRL
mmetsp:Transcript_21348/g.59559  ORF Transcript_21348/g.59559 Transcript_21348/m.59559 type:complete len:267 (-) Transcript_21348:206-1006(-)